MSELLDRFNDVCFERGIDSLEAFAARFGIAMRDLDIRAALTLAEIPAWVLDVWLPNAGSTRVVWIPEAVKHFASAYGIVQDEAESDHDFTLRLKAALTERMRGRAQPPPS